MDFPIQLEVEADHLLNLMRMPHRRLEDIRIQQRVVISLRRRLNEEQNIASGLVSPRLIDASVMAYHLSDVEMRFFKEHGFLVVRNLFTAHEAMHIQNWVKQVEKLPRTKDATYLIYDEVLPNGKRALCRTENFVDSHEKMQWLLRGERLGYVLKQLTGQTMRLFKEKINYKAPTAGGFAPHIDSTGKEFFNPANHLSVNIAIDPSTILNGCLEIVSGSHLMDIPVNEQTNCIVPDWAKMQRWESIELLPGEVLIFGSRLAHRSSNNKSTSSRRAIYATYNPIFEGDNHDAYYVQRAKQWPSTHLRVPGVDYAEGGKRYAFGSPMLSVEKRNDGQEKWGERVTKTSMNYEQASVKVEDENSKENDTEMGDAEMGDAEMVDAEMGDADVEMKMAMVESTRED